MIARHHLLPALFLAAVISVEVLAAVVGEVLSWPDLLYLLFVGFAFGQAGLLAAWLVFGDMWFLLRLVVTLAGIAGASIPFAGPGPADFREVMGTLLFYGMLVAAVATAPPPAMKRTRNAETATAHRGREKKEKTPRGRALRSVSLASCQPLALASGCGVIAVTVRIVLAIFSSGSSWPARSG